MRRRRGPPPWRWVPIPSGLRAALAGFEGTGRRFQLRGEADGVRVIDDYAHHPTEVAAVIAAARAAGAGHLVVLFQPALFTRTRDLHAGFAAALSVDRRGHRPRARSRRPRGPHRWRGLRSSSPRASTGPVVVSDSLESAAHAAAALAEEGDTVLTVGSGTVTRAPDWILAELEAR